MPERALDEVIMHFDMLYPCVEHRVPSQIDISHVVTVKGSRILDGYAQILEYPFEPYGFTCGHYLLGNRSLRMGREKNRMIEGPVVTSPTGWKGHICEYVLESSLGLYV